MTTATEIISALASLTSADRMRVIIAAAAMDAETPPAAEPPTPEDNDALTIEEAAALLRRSTKWLYRHRASLPFVKKIGSRSYLVSKSGLLRWRDRSRG